MLNEYRRLRQVLLNLTLMAFFLLFSTVKEFQMNDFANMLSFLLHFLILGLNRRLFLPFAMKETVFQTQLPHWLHQEIAQVKDKLGSHGSKNPFSLHQRRKPCASFEKYFITNSEWVDSQLLLPLLTLSASLVVIQHKKVWR